MGYRTSHLLFRSFAKASLFYGPVCFKVELLHICEPLIHAYRYTNRRWYVLWSGEGERNGGARRSFETLGALKSSTTVRDVSVLLINSPETLVNVFIFQHASSRNRQDTCHVFLLPRCLTALGRTHANNRMISWRMSLENYWLYRAFYRIIARSLMDRWNTCFGLTSPQRCNMCFCQQAGFYRQRII